MNFTERPWGHYIKFLQEEGVWVKRVEVKPACRLSLQKHFKRSEKWNIVTGNGIVTIDGIEHKVKAGDVVDVPLGAVHRIANNGTAKLVFIEVACGEYLGEDDIERMEDDYDRKGNRS
ncbi:MAG: phosphomannose isomerase type II C-terminal cupin domain [Candidatus Omnitrophica bacterium]|nr:phosphomannose isomerase type II C-terminal cupin domain [Candidatus Omnitrophota bacterium]